jgi:hypothetical protein
VEVARHDVTVCRPLVRAEWDHPPVVVGAFVERVVERVPDELLLEAVERRPVPRCAQQRRQIAPPGPGLGLAGQRYAHQEVEAAQGVSSVERRVRDGQGMGQIFQPTGIDQEVCLIR